jgi:AcrR family transcriptional regulator
MASYDKGIESRDKILRGARELFYARGFVNTTVRGIAKRTNLNPGLIKYYFGSKTEIARQVYVGTRSEFDMLILAQGYERESMETFLLSSAVDLYVSLTCPRFGIFYDEILRESEVQRYIRGRVMTGLAKYAQISLDPEETVISCLSIIALKPALIGYNLQNENTPLPTEKLMRHYLRRQILLFGANPDLCEKTIFEMQKYHIGLRDHFTPIFSPNLHEEEKHRLNLT